VGFFDCVILITRIWLHDFGGGFGFVSLAQGFGYVSLAREFRLSEFDLWCGFLIDRVVTHTIAGLLGWSLGCSIDYSVD
jgi:hypothetical protein